MISRTTVKPQSKCFKHPETNSSTILIDTISTKQQLLFANTTTTTNRIYGGSDAVYSESPWTVYIKYDSSGSIFTHDCTGSLINKQWIITAARCNYGSKRYPNKFSRIRVFLRSSKPGRESGVMIPVQTIHLFRHRLYNNTLEICPYDIALYKLEHSVDDNIGDGLNYPLLVNQLCLPANDTIYNAWAELATMYGWGGSEYIPIGIEPLVVFKWQISPTVLQKTTVQLNSNHECRGHFLCSYHPKGWILNSTGCDGDLGGGLVQYIDDYKGRAVLIGIYVGREATNKWTIDCADNTKTMYWIPVAKHIDWILETIKNN
ncbi:chymotrypsin-like elastase family member 3B [Oppia nitens]|uniref:chymotrypsin-like elastase family member 3B n=1 Tax=Oppia nitens TaxID=1686743 RepID=UPI0023DB9A25|nr:chymotrypsin-like elastase family member 3B [Oppia nitens]